MVSWLDHSGPQPFINKHLIFNFRHIKHASLMSFLVVWEEGDGTEQVCA